LPHPETKSQSGPSSASVFFSPLRGEKKTQTGVKKKTKTWGPKSGLGFFFHPGGVKKKIPAAKRRGGC